MKIRDRRYVAAAYVLLLLLFLILVTVIAQEREQIPHHPSNTNQIPGYPSNANQTPASNTGFPVNSHDVFRPTPPATDVRPDRTPATPTPTPELGCTTCLENVPVFNLEEGEPPSKVKLWRGLKSEGADIDVALKPAAGGATSIRFNFRDLVSPPTGSKYVVWARLPDDQFVPLGELGRAGEDINTSLTGSLASKQFGLFVTLESVGKNITPMEKSAVPSGMIVATVEK